MTSEDQKREVLKRLWPVVQRTLPKPWTVPLTMTATAMMPFVRLTDREEQLFRYQNMEASLQIRIGVPAWLLQDFAGMLQSPAGETLNMVMYRYHYGSSLTVQDWEDHWFQVTCYPHFSLIPYTDETQDDRIDYARMAFVKEYGLQPY
jgi:hypothetical protein